MICKHLVAAGLHLASWHSGPMAGGRDYALATTGAYLRCETGLQLGVFRNSERRISGYAAYFLQRGPVFAGLGLATGYRAAPLYPVGGVGVHLGRWRVMYAPPAPKNGVHLIHLAVEFGL